MYCSVLGSEIESLRLDAVKTLSTFHSAGVPAQNGFRQSGVLTAGLWGS